MEGDEKYITGVDLKQHNKEGDLWISIQGKVYNVSDWAHEHPGGDVPLLNQAGQDVTDAFIAYHPGTAWQYLDKFFTGYYLKDLKVSETSKDYRRLASEFAKLGSALVLGFLWIQSSYIGHDSGHYQVMKSRGYNKFAQFVSGNCLTGISMAWWKWTHNAHHLACNSLDYDPDLQHIPFLCGFL
ncbi:hypothetical protein NC653_006707 [Populus alba x Populus x berolinensis]|uniref:Cytochrome b5 heme-binding domain-containing protein n=1 Tax=Populus alba x Populus x berolinensis TaxID=444605 RepID=A0AAD6WCJ2_9ROSI|nr:hypothetical protein NC653_006707 [Populus alba x Populus x berolinensis]